MFDGHFVLYYDLVCKESVVLWNRFLLGTNRLFKSHLILSRIFIQIFFGRNSLF